MRVAAIIVVFGLWVGEALRRDHEVFEPGFETLRKNHDYCLDYFVGKQNAIPQRHLGHLTLCLRAPAFRSDADYLSAYYSSAAKNLRAAAPALKTLELNGGYVFRPTNMEDGDRLKNEIRFLRVYLDAVTKSLKDEKILVKSALVNVALIFDEAAKNSSDYENLIANVFDNSTVVDDTQPDGLELLVHSNDAELHVNLCFITNIAEVRKTRLPIGRTFFLSAAEVYLKPLWREMDSARMPKVKELNASAAFDESFQLFPPNAKRVTAIGRAHLEEFFDSTPGLVNELVEQVTAGMATPPAMFADVPPEEYYTNAMGNLKATAPNLRRVRFEGGYILSLQNATAKDLDNEPEYLHKVIDAAVSAAKSLELELIGIKLKVVWLFGDEVLAEFNDRKFYDQVIAVRLISVLPLLLLVGAVWSEESTDEILEASSKLRIENFVALKNTTLVENQPDVTLTARLFIKDEKANANEYYQTAIKNMKEVAPKVHTLSVYGGHVYFPEHCTPEKVRAEIELVKTNLQALLRAINNGGIKLTSNLFTILIVADQQSQKDANVEEFVGKMFGKDAIVDDTNEDGLELLFDLEDNDIHMYIVFLNAQDEVKATKLPFGYMSYVRAMKLHLEKVYEKLKKETDARIHRDDSKLFVAGIKRLNRAGDLHLEDFNTEKFPATITDKSPQKDLEQLVLSLGFPDDGQDPEEFYKKAAANLKKYAPNLKKIRLDGGYTYNPEKPSDDDLKNEFPFMKKFITAVTNALKSEKIQVLGIKLSNHIRVSKESAEKMDWTALLKQTFNHELSDVEKENGRALMHMQLNGADVNIQLTLFDDVPKGLPTGRFSFYKGAEILDDLNKGS